MKNTLLIKLFAFLIFTLLYPAAFVFSDTLYYDSEGTVIDKTQYELNASNREKTLSIKLRDGYEIESTVREDPIKLRKTRIEQWRIMRSHYDPDSLPSRIETPLPKND